MSGRGFGLRGPGLRVLTGLSRGDRVRVLSKLLVAQAVARVDGARAHHDGADALIGVAYPSLELSWLALVLASRIVAGFPCWCPLTDWAHWITWHALRLAEAGRRAEALTASQEAVDLYRELALLNRDAYLPNLAMSLWNVGFDALRVHAVTADVVAVTTEGAGYFEPLAAAEPEASTRRHQAAAATLPQLHEILADDDPTVT